MRRGWLLVAVVVIAGCREAGTVEVIPLDGFDTCGATHIRAFLAEGGDCTTGCRCGSCRLCSEDDKKCTYLCGDVDGTRTCTLPLDHDRVRDGITLQPPHEGHYAAVYEYQDATGNPTTFICAEFDVGADGTADLTAEPEMLQGCCGSAGSAGEPLGE